MNMDVSYNDKMYLESKHSAEYIIDLTKKLLTFDNIDNLLSCIIKECMTIMDARGGKIYLPDLTKKYFDLKCAVWNSSNDHEYLIGNKKTTKGISLEIGKKHLLNKISRVTLKFGNVINSDHYLVFSAITGKVLELDIVDNYSSYKIQQVKEFDKKIGYQTDTIMVWPLRDVIGNTIGLLELNNYTKNNDKTLISAFTSLSAVLINNLNLISRSTQLLNDLDETNHDLEIENNRLKKSVSNKNDYQIIGKSKVMKDVFSLLDKVVDSNVTVLLRGDTGTGKEVFAKAIHLHSPRSNQPLIIQNCAALPENLLESELFGYKKGAFTGADTDKIGLFDQANGGTMFLDEIGDMPVNLQAKVLRVIQDQEIRPLGNISSHKVDVRIIAATHCDLEEKISIGQFRRDLFYRLNIFPIELPKLCQRENDVILLINHFLMKYCKLYQRHIKRIDQEAIDILTRYQYPGNIRELQNIIERSVLLCNEHDVLLKQHIPVEVMKQVCGEFNQNSHLSSDINVTPQHSLKSAVQVYEAKLIKDKLKANNWNQTVTAQLLKLPRRTLVDKISRFNIDIPK